MPSPRSLLLILALLLGLASGGGARGAVAAQEDEAARRASELLALSAAQNQTDHGLALQTAREARDLLQTTPDRAGLARAYAQIGQYHLAQSQLPEAVENYETALGLWEELADPKGQADVLTSLGYIEARRSEWAIAFNLFARAEALLVNEDAAMRLRGRIASGLAYVFNESGLPQSGLLHYEQALGYYNQAEDASDRDRAMARLVIGGTHRLLGNFKEARERLEEVLPKLTKGGVDEALCRLHLGRVYLAAYEYNDAIPHLEASLKLYESAGNPKEAAQARAHLGHVYEQQGRAAAARNAYGRALATFKRLSDRINQSAVLYRLGRLELAGGRLAAAENYLRQSIEVTENVRRVSKSSDLTAAFSATVHDRYEAYVECLMRQHEERRPRGLDVRAFETKDLALARSLSELLRATQTSLLPGLDPQLAEREKSLRQALRVKEDAKVALLARPYRAEELGALEAELARLEGEYREVAETIRARYPAYERMARPAARSLRQIQEEVLADDETVLLEYSLGPGHAYVWAVTRDTFRSYRLPVRAPVEIEEAAKKVYELLAAPYKAGQPDDLTPAADELGRMILRPVAAELANKRRVVVVADGVLNYVPFQILPPQPGGEPLVAGYEVVNAPSASILGELRQAAAGRRPAVKLLAAFGNPVFDSNYQTAKAATGGGGVAVGMIKPGGMRRDLRGVELKADVFDPALMRPLFYSKHELASLMELAGGEALVAEEFDATRELLLRTDLGQYSIVHFATHGLLNSERPEFSGLVLSTVDAAGLPIDGFVGLSDVYRLRAPVDLVVLSACRTALGKEVRGEGLLGLTRGFMYAGASGVVSSLWKVDDEATAELMRQFYSNLLREGMAPAAALREAQNSIRRRPGWESPHFWAAFTLQGEHRRVIRPAAAPAPVASASTSAKALAGGASLLILLSAGGAWWLRRRAATRR